MVKKILIPVVAFIGLLSMGFYKTNPDHKETNLEAEYEPIVVLELFTSQGCSSCPPADVLLDKAKKQHPEQVYALSYHVDYWNYIGWEDPFSNPAYSKKQREYNIKFGYPSNYTPELVINGQEHFVGSNGSKLDAKIKQYGSLKTENGVALDNVSRGKSQVDFNYQLDGKIADKLLRAVLVLDQRTTSVKRGENRNRTLTNSNIVVGEKYITLESLSGQGSIAIPNWIDTSEQLNLVVLVEKGNLELTGAAKTRI